MVPVMHSFGASMALKSICVFVSTEEEKRTAMEAGAANAGGAELIDEIMKGRVEIVSFLRNDFFCHHFFSI